MSSYKRDLKAEHYSSGYISHILTGSPSLFLQVAKPTKAGSTRCHFQPFTPFSPGSRGPAMACVWALVLEIHVCWPECNVKKHIKSNSNQRAQLKIGVWNSKPKPKNTTCSSTKTLPIFVYFQYWPPPGLASSATPSTPRSGGEIHQKTIGKYKGHFSNLGPLTL